jgi:pyrimidine operon attenuation protein/uracil phosphoribosyltransferase
MSDDIEPLLQTMAQALRNRLNALHISDPLMIGIHSGGVWVAERLHALLHLDEPLGKLDISFYRDDFTRIGLNPAVRPSKLPFTVDGRHIILVDDVLYTGRTVRAALNEIFDYGRPDSVLLAALVDRGGRELPIQADVVGTTMDLSGHEHVKLSGPTPLQLIIKQAP